MKLDIKGVVTGTLLAFSSCVFAVDTTDFSKPGMKQLAVEKRAMESCMAEVDEIQQIRLQAQLNVLDNQLHALCDVGEQEKAQNTALAFSAQVVDLPLFQKIQRCTQGMRDLGFLPQLPVVKPDSEALYKICDYYRPYVPK